MNDETGLHRLLQYRAPSDVYHSPMTCRRLEINHGTYTII